jgi:hypothetical protein
MFMTINDRRCIANHVMTGRWSATAGRSALGGSGNSGAEGAHASVVRPRPINGAAATDITSAW